MEEVVASGTWRYADTTSPVHVVRTDYDFWFALGEAEDDLEPGERPRLNAQGHLYYVRFRPGWSPGESFWPDSPGYPTLDQARTAAEGRVSTGITWDGDG